MPSLMYVFDFFFFFFVIWRYAIGGDEAQFTMVMKTCIHICGYASKSDIV